MPNLRSQAIHTAASLPKGDPRRTKILAALKEGESMDESIAKYQKLADQFARLGRVKVTDLRHTGDSVMALCSLGDWAAFDPKKLASWLTSSGLSKMKIDSRYIALHWHL